MHLSDAVFYCWNWKSLDVYIYKYLCIASFRMCMYVQGNIK